MKMQTQNRKKIRQYVDQNPVEAFRDIGQGIVGSAKNDVIGGSLNSFASEWKQFLGAETKGQEEQILSGDLTPGSEISLAQLQETQKEASQSVENIERVMPGLDYHREIKTAEVRAAREDEAGIKQRLTEIQYELKKLIASSRELQTTFKQVTVERVPQKVGRYHLNFVEWLLSVVKTARLRVDESKSWISVLFAKRAKRQYWAMFKKHGTTFGLSHERTVATQTG